MKKALILFAITLAIVSCKPKQTATETSSSTEQKANVQQTDTLQSITINELVDMKNTGDPYSVENAKISGDTLIINLSYGGGCEEHSFELLNNFAFKEHTNDFGKIGSYETRITLKHNANNDRCRSIVRSEERFDLTKIRQVGVNKIKMNLSGWENELTYIYSAQKH